MFLLLESEAAPGLELFAFSSGTKVSFHIDRIGRAILSPTVKYGSTAYCSHAGACTCDRLFGSHPGDYAWVQSAATKVLTTS